MKKHLGRIRKCANLIVQQARVRWALMAVLAAIFLLRFYLIRELLALELFFALGFAVVCLLGGPVYLIGSAGVSWLEQPRRSQSNVAWGPAIVKNADPVKPSLLLEENLSNKKESVPNVSAI